MPASPDWRGRVIAFLIQTQAAEALPGKVMALNPAFGLNVKLWAPLFDPLPQNMNRAGSALSIIYNRSFSISCLSALVAVTCPDTNGGRLGENIYQCYRRGLSSSILSLSGFWNFQYWHCTDSYHHYYTLLHVSWLHCLRKSHCPWNNLCLLHSVEPMNLKLLSRTIEHCYNILCTSPYHSTVSTFKH